MFMGGVAFAYYYPVIERYVLESRVEKDSQDAVEAMWILAYCIKAQFNDKHVRYVHHLRHRILNLVLHVRGNLSQYAIDTVEQQRIDGAWRELETSFIFP